MEVNNSRWDHVVNKTVFLSHTDDSSTFPEVSEIQKYQFLLNDIRFNLSFDRP